jgi:hypothetical protein
MKSDDSSQSFEQALGRSSLGLLGTGEDGIAKLQVLAVAIGFGILEKKHWRDLKNQRSNHGSTTHLLEGSQTRELGMSETADRPDI